VLGPVYSLVGDTTKTAEEQDKILHRAETISHALQLAASIAVFVVAVYFVKELTKYAQNRKNKTK
jgi:flagellar biogenesis protein FliO